MWDDEYPAVFTNSTIFLMEACDRRSFPIILNSIPTDDVRRHQYVDEAEEDVYTFLLYVFHLYKYAPDVIFFIR